MSEAMDQIRALTNTSVGNGLPGENQYSQQARDEWYAGNMAEGTTLTTLGAKATGGRTAAQYGQAYNEWLRERSASLADRDWQAAREDSAFQRKVRDYVAAGFSPLAALEGATGGNSAASAALPTGHKNVKSNGGISLAPLLMLFGMLGKAAIASNTATAAASQKSATAYELAASKAASARDLAEFREAKQDARLSMRLNSAKEVQEMKEASADARSLLWFSGKHEDAIDDLNEDKWAKHRLGKIKKH